jgi:hypothetical protein
VLGTLLGNALGETEGVALGETLGEELGPALGTVVHKLSPVVIVTVKVQAATWFWLSSY